MDEEVYQSFELHGEAEIVRLQDGRYYPMRGGKYAIERLPGGMARRISFETAEEAQAWYTGGNERGANPLQGG